MKTQWDSAQHTVSNSGACPCSCPSFSQEETWFELPQQQICAWQRALEGQGGAQGPEKLEPAVTG